MKIFGMHSTEKLTDFSLTTLLELLCSEHKTQNCTPGYKHGQLKRYPSNSNRVIQKKT
jgi:hypothetical protein